MNPPKFDFRVTYDVSRLHNHKLQKLFALFVSRPELYADMPSLSEGEKQDYMFYQFGRMLENEKYYVWNYEKEYDELAYFGSLNIDRAGAVNVCGGGGGCSSSGRNQFIGKYKAGQEARKKSIEYLSKKYKLVFGSVDKTDPRLFLGHTEPWKNLSPALLEKEGWEWVKTRAYSDETFAAPFPSVLDSDLIPLPIRNKAVQKWRNSRRVEIVPTKTLDLDEEEEAEIPANGNTKAVDETPERLKQIMMAIAAECEEEDW